MAADVPFGQQVAILVLRDDAAESDHNPSPTRSTGEASNVVSACWFAVSPRKSSSVLWSSPSIWTTSNASTTRTGTGREMEFSATSYARSGTSYQRVRWWRGPAAKSSPWCVRSLRSREWNGSAILIRQSIARLIAAVRGARERRAELGDAVAGIVGVVERRRAQCCAHLVRCGRCTAPNVRVAIASSGPELWHRVSTVDTWSEYHDTQCRDSAWFLCVGSESITHNHLTT